MTNIELSEETLVDILTKRLNVYYRNLLLDPENLFYAHTRDGNFQLTEWDFDNRITGFGDEYESELELRLVIMTGQGKKLRISEYFSNGRQFKEFLEKL